MPERSRSRDTTGRERIDRARREKRAIVKQLFAAAKVRFPPRQVLLRAFKKENRIEVWAATKAAGALSHVTTYQVCYASGELGPKRREGDLQVPEGFYRLSFFKAKSDYHMAMQVSYPNTSDRILGDPHKPGGEIMVHGDCVSIGCLAMSDERIEELWLITRAAPLPIRIHIFPSRDIEGLIASRKYPQHEAFWRNLKTGFDRFNKDHVVPGVRVNTKGSYSFY